MIDLYKNEIHFLEESNLIENESSPEALEDAIKAWEYTKEMVVPSIHHVLEIHRILLERVNPRIAGKFRDCDVMIGGEVKRFINHDVLTWQVDGVISGIKRTLQDHNTGARALIAKQSHIDFEKVHPFEDGNGRVGRILYNWHRVKLGLPIHVIHNAEKYDNYYPWFRE